MSRGSVAALLVLALAYLADAGLRRVIATHSPAPIGDLRP